MNVRKTPSGAQKNEWERLQEARRFEKIKQHHRQTFEKALREGKMDPPLIKLCQYIARSREYFTSSGCAGRILLLDSEQDDEKKEGLLYAKWHETVPWKTIQTAIEKHPGPGLWFKTEPFILHLGCANLENAQKILQLKEKAGIRRGGIMVASPGKFIIELVGTPNLALPIKQKGKMLADPAFLKNVLKTANRKLSANYRKLRQLTRTIQKTLK
ncbi:MAG: hypothetical protein HY917_04185 [Candidatus Diapherotrites archaeon]|nr:hypothetical protein [Candidatus Diapherotrites archaeon]